MDFPRFADVMEKIGFRYGEPIAPIFTISSADLKNSVFKHGYTKIVGRYRVIGMWEQGGEVALWANEENNYTKLFPFHKN